MKVSRNNFLLEDLLIIIFSIVIAVILVRTGVIISVLTSSKELEALGVFVAGMFFTSVFTIAPATVALGEIAQVNSPWFVAFFGGLGAVTGDVVIFRFVKDRFSSHLIELIKQNRAMLRLRTLFRLRFFRWLTFFVGGLIIASPLPDELGISLLGFSKMKFVYFIPLSFTANFLGILIIGLAARILA